MGVFASCWKGWLLLLVCALPGSKDLDLSDVRVATTLLVLQYRNLDVHGLCRGSVFVIQREYVPANRVLELNLLDLLQLMEAVGDSDGDLLRSVAFVCFAVQVEGDLLNTSLAEELNVDEVRLLAI